MRHVFAYSFSSPMTLGEMLAKLNGAGTWKWVERDSDRFGEYLSTRVLDSPDRGFVKVYAEPDHYAINVLLESDSEDATSTFDKIQEAVFGQLLPALAATKIVRTETYE